VDERDGHTALPSKARYLYFISRRSKFASKLILIFQYLTGADIRYTRFTKKQRGMKKGEKRSDWKVPGRIKDVLNSFKKTKKSNKSQCNQQETVPKAAKQKSSKTGQASSQHYQRLTIVSQGQPIASSRGRVIKQSAFLSPDHGGRRKDAEHQRIFCKFKH
jgi:hypothetical protein